jgi:hypothetical protein
MKSVFRRRSFKAFAGKRPNLFFHLAGFVLLFGLALLPAGAQQITGAIVGTVKDQQGAVVNTATVKATNVDTGFTRSAPVNGIGEFRIDFTFRSASTPSRRTLRPLSAMCKRTSPSTLARHCRLTSNW